MTKCLTEGDGAAAIAGVAAALANPRRVAVVERLCRGPATTSELADEVGLGLPTMQRHLEQLRDAHLITSAKHGRTVVHTADLVPLGELESWIATRRSFWTQQLDALAQAVEVGHDR